MKRNRIMSLLSVAAIAAAVPALPLAQAPAAGKASGPAAGTVADSPMTEGEVRKVDMDAGKITLKHGEIANLSMPPMTMVFTVRARTLLDALQAGDKVRFRVVSEGGQYIVTEIQRLN